MRLGPLDDQPRSRHRHSQPSENLALRLRRFGGGEFFGRHKFQPISNICPDLRGRTPRRSGRGKARKKLAVCTRKGGRVSIENITGLPLDPFPGQRQALARGANRNLKKLKNTQRRGYFRRNHNFDGGNHHWRRSLFVTEIADHFQHFAARGEHPSAGASVFVQGVHKLDFVDGIVAFAGGRIDLPPPVDLRPAFANSFFDGRRPALLPAIGDSPAELLDCFRRSIATAFSACSSTFAGMRCSWILAVFFPGNGFLALPALRAFLVAGMSFSLEMILSDVLHFNVGRIHRRC